MLIIVFSQNPSVSRRQFSTQSRKSACSRNQKIWILLCSVKRKHFQFRLSGEHWFSMLVLGRTSSLSIFLNLICPEWFDIFHLINLEPVGFKAPVFSTDSKTSHFERGQNNALALLCQAQAFPVPVFRYKSLMLGCSLPSFALLYKCLKNFLFVRTCRFQGAGIFNWFNHQSFSKESRFFLGFAVSSSSISSAGFQVNSVTLLCEVRWSFSSFLSGNLNPIFERNKLLLIPLTEPVGFKAPVFSTDSITSHFVRGQNSALALLCQAQAFPVPVFR